MFSQEWVDEQIESYWYGNTTGDRLITLALIPKSEEE